MPDEQNISGPLTAERFHRALPWLLLVSVVFFLSFLARIIFSPLLPVVEADSGISHSQAASFFFFISGGYACGLLCSGLLSSRISHCSTVAVSGAWVGVSLILLNFSQSLWLIYFTLFIFGIGPGFYLPSGISVVVSLVRPKDMGKALSVHELAPTIAFLLAPLMAEALLNFMSWRHVLTCIGIASLFSCVLFALIGRGDSGKTKPLLLRHFTVFFRRPAFWALASVSCMGIATSMGVYSVMPIYLVDKHNLSQDWANTLVSMSRATCLLATLLSGFMTDRMGAGRAMMINVAIAGLLTMLLGLFSGIPLIVAMIVQPMPAAAIFPPYFAILSTLFGQEERNLAISLIVPVGVFAGAGIIPALAGMLADAGLFYLAFILIGALTLLTVPLLRFVRPPES